MTTCGSPEDQASCDKDAGPAQTSAAFQYACPQCGLRQEYYARTCPRCQTQLDELFSVTYRSPTAPGIRIIALVALIGLVLLVVLALVTLASTGAAG